MAELCALCFQGLAHNLWRVAEAIDGDAAAEIKIAAVLRIIEAALFAVRHHKISGLVTGNHHLIVFGAGRLRHDLFLCD